jgi:ATP-binding cassette, subfamily B, bacterial
MGFFASSGTESHDARGRWLRISVPSNGSDPGPGQQEDEAWIPTLRKQRGPDPAEAGVDVPGQIGTTSDGTRLRKAPLLRVARLFKSYRMRLLGLSVMVILQAVTGVASPFMLRTLLDNALPHRNVTFLLELVGGMILASLASGGLGVITQQLSNIIGQAIMHDLRLAVYTRLQSMSLAFFTQMRSGELLSRVINDVGGVDTVLTSTASSAVQNGTAVVAVISAMMILDWQLAALALLVVPVFLLITIGLGRQRRNLVRGRQRLMAQLTVHVEESLSLPGVLLSKTMGLQKIMRDRFSAQSRAISQLELRASMVGRWRTASRRMSLTIIPAILYGLAGLEFAHGAKAATVGTVVAFTSMVNRLVAPASSIQGITQNLTSSLAVFARIFDVLDLPIDIDEKPGAAELAVTGGEVRYTDVCFRYADSPEWTLQDITLTMAPGTVTAIVGETGSGKTTMAYLVTRLYEQQQGVVSIDGADIRDVTLNSLCRAVGLVSQETYLMHTTIRENLLLARPDATQDEIEHAATGARIHHLIASLPDGYDTIVGARGYRFSGGERQRLAIARMILRNPPILVLDEATSALDTRTERAVQEALDNLAEGRTTIVIAHRLSTIVNADQIVVLDHGRIAQIGTHSELVSRDGRYAQLANAAHAL